MVNQYGPRPCEHCGKKPTSKKAGRPQNRRELSETVCKLMGWDDPYHFRSKIPTSRRMEDLIKRLQEKP